MHASAAQLAASQATAAPGPPADPLIALLHAPASPHCALCSSRSPPPEGSSLDFMRVYARLAARLQPLMMKQRAFPVATHAGQLLSATPSMDDSQRRAVQALAALAPASSCDEMAASASGGSAHPAAALEQRLEAAVVEDGVGGGGGTAGEQQAAAGGGDAGAG